MEYEALNNSNNNMSSLQDQLEAEPIRSNEQLLAFDVRSKNVNWKDYTTPLRSRSAAVYLRGQFNLLSDLREEVGEHNRRSVFVCHDMMGNYLEDKHFDSSKKFDDYRFYHWAAVDLFCYFSHNYITIPPCGWINAAHKHGVRVLGTFITENNDGAQRLHEVLQSVEMVNTVVAAMVKLCKHYGFEGWLINVECGVNPAVMPNLFYFLDRLRTVTEREVTGGVVLWYDSVIENGSLHWQNELNANNMRFHQLSHGTLINYEWNDRSLESTTALSKQLKTHPSSIYFGIDIFGRGQAARFQTKLTLARIARQNFSVGIFAPGWTYETLKNYGYNIKEPLGLAEVNTAFLERNEKFWLTLWEYVATYPYMEMPFYTDFCLGSGKNDYKYGVPKSPNDDPFFNLSRQSLQPSVPLYLKATRCYDTAFNGGSSLRIIYENSFRLIVSDFQLQHRGLVFAYAYKLDRMQDGEFDCILRICDTSGDQQCFLFLGDYKDEAYLHLGRCYVSPFKMAYHEHLTGPLNCTEIPKYPNQANGWATRYYVVAFDGPVVVKDIGVLYRKLPDADDSAYLGAIYLNEFDVNAYNLPNGSNAVEIPIYQNELFTKMGY